MCGRYRIIKQAKEIAERFDIAEYDIFERSFGRNSNASPSQNLPVITNLEQRKINFFRWGLIPSWAKDPATGYKMINARAETVAEKPSYKRSMKGRRCLVIADGFYEWKKTDGKKQPYL